MRIYIHVSCVKSVVHRNLKPFAESARVVRGRGAADLHPLSQAITETFNRIMWNLSELRKLLVTSTVHDGMNAIQVVRETCCACLKDGHGQQFEAQQYSSTSAGVYLHIVTECQFTRDTALLATAHAGAKQAMLRHTEVASSFVQRRIFVCQLKCWRTCSISSKHGPVILLIQLLFWLHTVVFCSN